MKALVEILQALVRWIAEWRWRRRERRRKRMEEEIAQDLEDLDM